MPHTFTEHKDKKLVKLTVTEAVTAELYEEVLTRVGKYLSEGYRRFIFDRRNVPHLTSDDEKMAFGDKAGLLVQGYDAKFAVLMTPNDRDSHIINAKAFILGAKIASFDSEKDAMIWLERL